ncbi:MAG: PfkB family carbohydrate kinase [Clostridia bacterium]|nr:PfkB family carbohydrate kinase [Clostridia bacterium]
MPSGHAIIEVDPSGENRIILFGGANQVNDEEYAMKVLSNFEKGDYVLLQNEIALTPAVAKMAHEKGMIVVLNPSPYNEKINEIDLNNIDLIILNETEGQMMTGKEDKDEILEAIKATYPNMEVVLTLGKDGSIYSGKNGKICQDIFKVKAVDTTAAGDTFTGYYLASLMSGCDEKRALRVASAASAISVTRQGASPSIPTVDEVKALADK